MRGDSKEDQGPHLKEPTLPWGQKAKLSSHNCLSAGQEEEKADDVERVEWERGRQGGAPVSIRGQVAARNSRYIKQSNRK